MEGIDPSNFYQFGSLAAQLLTNIKETLPDHPFFQKKPYALGCCQGALETLTEGMAPLFSGNMEVIEQLPQQSVQFLLRLVRGEIIQLPTDFSPHPLRTSDFLAVQSVLTRELARLNIICNMCCGKNLPRKKEGRGGKRNTISSSNIFTRGMLDEAGETRL
jgi:hypothetical protein